MVAEKAMTPVHERVVVPDPEVVAELEKVYCRFFIGIPGTKSIIY
jgi:hypothetical protein